MQDLSTKLQCLGIPSRIGLNAGVVALRASLPVRTILYFAICFASIASRAQAPVATTVTPVREADAVCGRCHQEILRKYLGTPMANASGSASERPIPGDFYNALSNTSYRVSSENNALVLHIDRPGDPVLKRSHKLSYFLGSGHLGVTYLYLIDGYLLESPVAYYERSRAYDMKPGLSQSHTAPAALPMPPGCMRCHMSDVQKPDPGTQNHYSGPPFLHGGITCERCHGDTSEHVRRAGKSKVINPSELDPERRDSICIVCHMEGDTSVQHHSRDVEDFRPGDKLSDYISYFVLTGANMTSRGVSEIEELSLSECKRISGDRMSCMSCHDPHASPAKEDRTRFYRSKCLACHTNPRYSTAHHADNPDCTSCHMPTGKSEDIPHVAWTDHRIRRQPEQLTLSAPDEAKKDLVSFLPGATSQRDLAVAYYNLYANGRYSFRDKARRMLASVDEAGLADATVLADLGYLAQSKRRPDEAMQFYQRALKEDPLNLPASNNLASLLAQSGNLEAAAQQWRSVFALHEDLESVGINLALADCRLEQLDQAQLVLKRVLAYSPDSATATQMLQRLQRGDRTCAAP